MRGVSPHSFSFLSTTYIVELVKTVLFPCFIDITRRRLAKDVLELAIVPAAPDSIMFLITNRDVGAALKKYNYLGK